MLGGKRLGDSLFGFRWFFQQQGFYRDLWFQNRDQNQRGNPPSFIAPINCFAIALLLVAHRKRLHPSEQVIDRVF